MTLIMSWKKAEFSFLSFLFNCSTFSPSRDFDMFARLWHDYKWPSCPTHNFDMITNELHVQRATLTWLQMNFMRNGWLWHDNKWTLFATRDFEMITNELHAQRATLTWQMNFMCNVRLWHDYNSLLPYFLSFFLPSFAAPSLPVSHHTLLSPFCSAPPSPPFHFPLSPFKRCM